MRKSCPIFHSHGGSLGSETALVSLNKGRQRDSGRHLSVRTPYGIQTSAPLGSPAWQVPTECGSIAKAGWEKQKFRVIILVWTPLFFSPAWNEITRGYLSHHRIVLQQLTSNGWGFIFLASKLLLRSDAGQTIHSKYVIDINQNETFVWGSKIPVII